ncbi:MAG TPA: DUF885 domain-containing protein [Candidatus Nanopelagicales bacterium]|nr:DUF885 domain-containing protein [Candidatus Nanopelagicales bacterium]
MTLPDSAAAVNALADRFWEATLEQHPTLATVYGDERWDDRLDDPSAAGRTAAGALRDATLAELAAIPVNGLPVEERITHDMLRVVCELGNEADLLRMDLVALVDQIDGPQALLPQGVQFQPADTPARLEKLLARLAAFEPFVGAHLGLLEEARATGMTAPRIVAERTISQAERLLAIPADQSPIVTGARLADGDAEGRAGVAAVVRDIVNPALTRYVEALRGPYFAATREAPGLWSAPDGAARYRMAIRTWTSLDLDPAEVHQVGLEELAALDADRLAIARAAGHDGIAAYRAHLAADPANQAPTKEDLVSRANEDIARALAIAPAWFGRLPVASCDVRPVEPFMERDAPPAFYYPPTVDGSRPGVYFVNTYDLPTRLLSKLAATTYHEAIPGHHFQIALEMEHPGLPAFRRLGSRMIGSAYAEGWGLYSERLADEMGLYRNHAERFGMLEAQAWRAVRLIVDTGIHALGKGRAWAVDLLREGAGLSATDAGIETDRYIVWPGQALTYKIGHREINRLRAELAARDGAAFDLRAFHDALLGHGSLALATLARELPAWVAPKEG